MKRNVLCGLALMTMLAAACGGDDDDGLKRDGRAPAKCRALAAAICESWVACGLIDESERAACQTTLESEEGDCDDATSVGSSYDECLDDLEENECINDFELPASCEDAIGIPE